MSRGRKLYYDVVLTSATSSVVVPLTQVSAGTPPDLDGAYLDALAAADGNATTAAKQRRELTAVFVPYEHIPAPEPAALLLTDFSPVEPGDHGTNGVIGTQPIALVFSAALNPATVDATSVQITFDPPEDEPPTWAPYSISVVGDEIRIENAAGTWLEFSNFDMQILLTSAIESLSGLSLDTASIPDPPGESFYLAPVGADLAVIYGWSVT